MFEDRLSIAVTLTVGSESFAVPGGDTLSCALRLHTWGFEGEVEFVIDADAGPDTLLPAFNKDDRVDAEVELTGTLPNVAEPPDALVLKGVVTEKRLDETVYRGLRDEPVLRRRYCFCFSDTAAVLWREHFPIDLTTDAKLQDLLEDHVTSGTTLDIDAPDAGKKRSVNFLSCGESACSFYDFVVWLADRQGAYFLYDYAKDKYALAKARPTAGTAAKVRSTEVASLTHRFPETVRHAARVHNGSTEDARTVDVANAQAVAGVFRDHLLRTAVSADVDARKKTETSRIRLRKPELDVEFSRFPTVAYWPGTDIELHADYFSDDRYGAEGDFRVAEVGLRARRTKGEDDGEKGGATGAPDAKFQVELLTRWEAADESWSRLPSYAAPEYPRLVEGKIVCDVGKKGDRTYHFESDSATSLSVHKVTLPLWKKTVPVPFTAQFLPGHVYAPTYRDARVLVALYPHRAELRAYLDWGPDAQLPSSSQGNHLLFGKNKEDQTSLKHVYEDEKPVFSIDRKKKKDTEQFKMEDGLLVIELEEK